MPAQGGRQIGDVHGLVDGTGVQRRLGHGRRLGVERMLDEGDAAPLIHGEQPRGAIVQEARQHQPDDAAGESQRGRAEQGIDRGTGQVLPRAAAQADHPGEHQHVMVGRREIDAAVLDRLAVDRDTDFQRGNFVEVLDQERSPFRAVAANHDASCRAALSRPRSGDVRKQAAPPHRKKSPIVGIGASAGGIRPLQTFFETLPDDLGLTYVVILHLAPPACRRTSPCRSDWCCTNWRPMPSNTGPGPIRKDGSS